MAFINLLAGLILPTAGAYIVPYSQINSGTARNQMVVVFPTAVKSTIEVGSPLHDYSSAGVLTWIWTSETASNNTDFEADHRTSAVNDTEPVDINTSPDNRVQTLVDLAAPSAASELVKSSITLTTTDLAADDYFSLKFSRDGVTDTGAGAVTLWALFIKYTAA